MDDGKQHVLVCTNVDCLRRGSPAVLDAMRARVEASGSADVEVTSYPCFGGCDYGPNVVLYPPKTFYSGVAPADVDEIVAHVQGGPVVERLTGKVDSGTQELIFELLDAGLI